MTNYGSKINPLATNPSRPIYLIVGKHGGIEGLSQDPDLAHSTPRENVVHAEWPRPDWCGRKRPHPPHTWGGDGWSEFRCVGERPLCALCESEPVAVGRDVCTDCEARQ